MKVLIMFALAIFAGCTKPDQPNVNTQRRKKATGISLAGNVAYTHTCCKWRPAMVVRSVNLHMVDRTATGINKTP